jgi:hypothetical protein
MKHEQKIRISPASRPPHTMRSPAMREELNPARALESIDQAHRLTSRGSAAQSQQSVVHLQRLVGNRNVQALLTRQREQGQISSSSPADTPHVQRMPAFIEKILNKIRKPQEPVGLPKIGEVKWAEDEVSPGEKETKPWAELTEEEMAEFMESSPIPEAATDYGSEPPPGRFRQKLLEEQSEETQANTAANSGDYKERDRNRRLIAANMEEYGITAQEARDLLDAQMEIRQTRSAKKYK